MKPSNKLKAGFLVLAAFLISLNGFAQNTSPKNDFSIRKSITIKASPSNVWAALTRPDLIKKYYYGYEVTTGCNAFSMCAANWQQGDLITYRKDGKDILRGYIVKIIPNQYLQVTSGNAQELFTEYTFITYELSFVNGVTVLTMTETGFSGDNAQQRYMASKSAWDNVLGNLKTVVEKQPDSYSQAR